MGKHFRAPIFDAFRDKSPFRGLWDHAAKMKECITALEEAVTAYVGGDFAAAAEHAKRVSELELESDLIKSNIRNHLPSNVRMPVDKQLFIQALHEQDHVLDEAEDAAIWMTMRTTRVPADVADGFAALLAKVVACVDAYEVAVANTHDLVESGFVKREREEEKVLIHRVHELEHETDVLGRSLSGRLLAPETEAAIGPIAVYHLLKLALLLSKVADHAENAGDRLRAMLGR